MFTPANTSVSTSSQRPLVVPSAPTSSIRTTTPIHGRPPRSRRNRPCDQCRRAKSRCEVTTSGPPCTLCAESSRDCTFDAAPPVRKQRAATAASDVLNGRRSASPERASGHDDSSTPSSIRRSRSPIGAVSTPRLSSDRHGRRDAQGPSRPSALRVPVTNVSSFDRLASSDKFDAHVLTVVLTDDLLPIAEGDDEGRPHVKQISQDPQRPIFVVMDPKPEPFRQPTAGAVALTHIHALLRNHPLHLTTTELQELYHGQVHPALPILPRGPTDSHSPLLLGSIIATALSHSKRTRELAAPVAGMLEISYAGLGEHNLGGVASAILDLGMRGVNSSRASYLLLAKTIALAQVLGMHISPKSWAIPQWEQELRIRLWWMLSVHDSFMSFLNSRPSHMQAHNATVPLPDRGSILDAACTFGPASSDSSSAFLAMCELSLLVHKLQRACCTLGSMGRSSSAREDDVEQLYLSTEAHFAKWHKHATGAMERATGVASFLVHLLGFRCMLMRIRLELQHGLSSPFEPESSNLRPFSDLVDFVQLLDARDTDGYWLIYAGHILSSVVSSLIRLSMASPGALNQEAMALLSRLLRSLGSLHGDHGWDIAAPALLRAKSMAGRLKSMNEHEPLVHALLGTESSPNVDDLFAAMGQETALGQVEPQLVWDWNGMDLDFASLTNLMPS